MNRANAQLSSPTSSPLMSLFSMLFVVPGSEDARGTQQPVSELSALIISNSSSRL